MAPTDAAQVAEAVADAAADGTTLEIRAGGTRRALGRPAQGDVLDVSGLSGIVDYDPAELVLTARAATPLAVIAAAMDGARQVLAFEPPDWRALLETDGEPTLGGTIACNAAGPRRVRAGAARDHLLGFSAVNGWGDAWKAGGRVVKNVTGYDMCKLQAGAYGTLSVLTELSVRMLPRPETACTLVRHGLDDAAAIVAMAAALNSQHEVSAAAHLPAAAARRLGFPGAATLLRLEGPAPSVAFRAGALDGDRLGGDRLDAAETARVWQAVGSVAGLIDRPGRVVWRVCPTPSAAARVAAEVAGRLDTQAAYDWGGGLLWLALAGAGPDGGAAIVRAAVARAGGHATLLAAPAALRGAVDVFEPEAPPLAALSRRVKDGFDPHGVLNRGRMRPDH